MNIGRGYYRNGNRAIICFHSILGLGAEIMATHLHIDQVFPKTKLAPYDLSVCPAARIYLLLSTWLRCFAES